MSPPVQQPDHGSIAHELAMLRVELQANTKETREVKHLLTGNGTPQDGLVLKVDRLEQSELRRNAIAGAAVIAAVGALVTTGWNKLTGKG